MRVAPSLSEVMAAADELEFDEGCEGRFFGRRLVQHALQTSCCFSLMPPRELYVRSSNVTPHSHVRRLEPGVGSPDFFPQAPFLMIKDWRASSWWRRQTWQPHRGHWRCRENILAF